MRPPSHTWFELIWPREVTHEQSLTTLLGLAGMATYRRSDYLVLQVVGEVDGLHHYVAGPSHRAAALRQHVRASGVEIARLDGPPQALVSRSWRMKLTSQTRPLEQRSPEMISQAILVALADVHGDERLVLQWILGPARPPMAVGSRGPGRSSVHSVSSTLLGGLIPQEEVGGENRRLLRTKRALPGWKADLRVGVFAGSRARQHQLLGRLAVGLRMAQAPGVQIHLQRSRVAQMANAAPPLIWPLQINAGELRGGLAGWPVGSTADLKLRRARSRHLPVPSNVPRTGRVIGVAGSDGESRPVALSVSDSLYGVHLIGPTGTGKSTAILNLMLADAEAGRGLVLFEPKNDGVEDFLSRVPEHRLDDIVVLDPTDSAVVGVSPLATDGTPGDLAVDRLLAVFKGIFGEQAIGPRSLDILSAGLSTLAATPGTSLVGLPRLFSDEAYRREMRKRARDPFTLDPFWQWFDDQTPAMRAAALAPIQNKLRMLYKPQIRRVLGQRQPRFRLEQIFTERKILLVNLAQGTVGPEASRLLASIIFSQLWQVIQARHRVPAERRHPVFVFLDEFQSYLHVSEDIAEVLARSRGASVGLHLGHQHLAQLTPDVRAATLANARNRIFFQTNADDARHLIGTDDRITPADVEGLGRHEIYARLMVDGEATPLLSARTLPPPPVLRDPAEARQRSRERWGIPIAQIDAELEGAVQPETPTTEPNETFGVRPRPKGDG